MTPELLPAPNVSVGVEAEWWLHELTVVSRDQLIVWYPHGYRRGSAAVRSLEHLSLLDSRLPEPGERTLVEWSGDNVRRWCQKMCNPTGWCVDAHDGTPDDFVKRVFRGEPSGYTKAKRTSTSLDFELG